MINIRRASTKDAKSIAYVINSVVDEKKYTSLRKFTDKEEREYIRSLNEREAIFVAEKDGKIVGIQTIGLFAKWSESMNHVGHVLTLILKEYRGQGIGKLLAEKTLEFACSYNYEKIASYVMEDNIVALQYYESLGFKPIGKWLKQVKIDGTYHNDIITELFL